MTTLRRRLPQGATFVVPLQLPRLILKLSRYFHAPDFSGLRFSWRALISLSEGCIVEAVHLLGLRLFFALRV